ncbi:MAG: CopG family transcriptional regulator, partial [Pseudonocardiaceae bacterium]
MARISLGSPRCGRSVPPSPGSAHFVNGSPRKPGPSARGAYCGVCTNIYLDEEQTALLDRLAADQGTSRADLIRVLLERTLRNEDDDVAADLAAIDESFGALAD